MSINSAVDILRPGCIFMKMGDYGKQAPGWTVKKKIGNPRLYVATISLAAVIFLIDLLIPLGVAGGVPYVAVVLLALWSPKKEFIAYMGILCVLLTVLGYFASPEGGELWKVLANRFLAVFAISVAATMGVAYRRAVNGKQREINELRTTLSNTKTIKGIIPICASCKNIRDEKGAWERVETYVGEHTEAIFTHGVCPDCFEILYPDNPYSPKKNSSPGPAWK